MTKTTEDGDSLINLLLSHTQNIGMMRLLFEKMRKYYQPSEMTADDPRSSTFRRILELTVNSCSHERSIKLIELLDKLTEDYLSSLSEEENERVKRVFIYDFLVVNQFCSIDHNDVIRAWCDYLQKYNFCILYDGDVNDSALDGNSKNLVRTFREVLDRGENSLIAMVLGHLHLNKTLTHPDTQKEYIDPFAFSLDHCEGESVPLFVLEWMMKRRERT